MQEDDSVAQLVEHNTFNVGVLGSSPSGITQKRDSLMIVSFLFLRYWKYFIASGHFM